MRGLPKRNRTGLRGSIRRDWLRKRDRDRRRKGRGKRKKGSEGRLKRKLKGKETRRKEGDSKKWRELRKKDSFYRKLRGSGEKRLRESANWKILIISLARILCLMANKRQKLLIPV